MTSHEAMSYVRIETEGENDGEPFVGVVIECSETTALVVGVHTLDRLRVPVADVRPWASMWL